MNSVRLKNLSLKYQRFTPLGGKNIRIRKSEFVTKTQFLYRFFFRGFRGSPWGHVRFYKHFWTDRFSRFNVYWIIKTE